MEGVATKALGAVATTVATRLASEVVDDGIDVVEENKGRRAKIVFCTILVAMMLCAIYFIYRTQRQ